MLDMQWVGVSSEVVTGKELEPIQQMSASAEALAHLEYLRIEGVVERVVTEDRALFKSNVKSTDIRIA